jgi:ribosome-binding factor A
MSKGYRTGRLGEEIRKLVSDLILRELKDPRLSGIVSITGVDVTADHSHATLYISVLGDTKQQSADQQTKQEVLNAFQSAKGLIRKEIGKNIKLRHVPDLHFQIDTSQEYGRQIETIIAELGLGQKKEGDPDEEL